MKKKTLGFTLIELLIVVAIIAILAAIAVPNFLEAQTRAKVSRVKSDIRSLATGLESYRVDNNVPPPSAGEISGTAGLVGGPLTINGVTGNTGIMGWWLSTPVAYMTSALMLDPFVPNGNRPDLQIFSYHTQTFRWGDKAVRYGFRSMATQENASEGITGAAFGEIYGSWRIFSIGPDTRYANNLGGPANTFRGEVGIPYDPSNGTISAGNVFRSEKGEPNRWWSFATSTIVQ